VCCRGQALRGLEDRGEGSGLRDRYLADLHSREKGLGDNLFRTHLQDSLNSLARITEASWLQVALPSVEPLPNKPMKLSIRPQGHWCSIEGATRRPARSLSASR
jgi:hypothetical protein